MGRRGLGHGLLGGLLGMLAVGSPGVPGISILPAAGEDTGAEAPLTIEQAMTMALASNRDLAAARLGRDEARAQVQIAKERPNPEFAFEAERETPHQSYTLSLPVETGGKRRRRVEVSEAAAGSTDAEIARLEAQTRVAVRRAYFTLWAAQRRVAEMREIAALAAQTLKTAQDRFESGEVARLEAMQADLNRAQADNDLAAAEAEVTSARVELNTLLALPPAQPTRVDETAGAIDLPGEQAAMDMAQRASVELALLDRRIAEEQARLGLARSQQVPDVVVQGAVTTNSQPEFDTGWRAGVSLVLPIFTLHRGGVHLEQSTLARLQSEREAQEARIRGTVLASLSAAAAKREQFLRYRDAILPQATEVEKLASESYRAGQTSLVTMLQATGTLRDVRLRSVGSGLDYQIALAELESAIGAPLP